VRVLIAGAPGQLGRELVRLGGAYRLLAVDHEQLDICDADAVNRVCQVFAPDLVINAAAYTAVDRAESDADTAFAVNRDGAANLARVCSRFEIPLIHVSTDYIFDGSKLESYVETDSVAPLGVYGRSKLAGEQAVQAFCPKHLILRTSWVFSAHGNNFVKTMLRLGADREELGIVADQRGCPTSAAELARMIYLLCDSGLENRWGVYHLCQPEAVTWFEFANAVFAEAAKQGMDLKIGLVKPIATTDYQTPARRPANSVMDCSKIEQTFRHVIRPWSESLHEVIKELKDD
jgi:dTDP-4-dehydrorhamnose reductase